MEIGVELLDGVSANPVGDFAAAAVLRAAVQQWLERRRQEEIDRQLTLGYGAAAADPLLTDAMADAGRRALDEADLDW